MNELNIDKFESFSQMSKMVDDYCEKYGFSPDQIIMPWKERLKYIKKIKPPIKSGPSILNVTFSNIPIFISSENDLKALLEPL